MPDYSKQLEHLNATLQRRHDMHTEAVELSKVCAALGLKFQTDDSDVNEPDSFGEALRIISLLIGEQLNNISIAMWDNFDDYADAVELKPIVLTFTQDEIDDIVLQNDDYIDDDYIRVLKFLGKRYVCDGNHRAVKAHINNRKVAAMVIDLDDLLKDFYAELKERIADESYLDDKTVTVAKHSDFKRQMTNMWRSLDDMPVVMRDPSQAKQLQDLRKLTNCKVLHNEDWSYSILSYDQLAIRSLLPGMACCDVYSR